MPTPLPPYRQGMTTKPTYPKKLSITLHIGGWPSGICVDDENGRTWALVNYFSADDFPGELLNRWNAHEAMLEALQAYIEHFDSNETSEHVKHWLDREGIPAMRAAIHAATGGN